PTATSPRPTPPKGYPVPMNTPTSTKPTPAELAAEEFRRHPGFLPGSAKRLGELFKKAGGLPPAAGARKVAELVADTPLVAKHWDPEYVAPTLPNGAPRSPVRQALIRYVDMLKPGAVEALTAAWSADLAGLPPGLLAELERRYLAGP